METPCINICVLDDASGICIGCGRSGGEIARWVEMSPAERRAIMDTLPERLKRLERESAAGDAEPASSDAEPASGDVEPASGEALP
ncbi:MAG: hypothetical protein A49_19850 [Methyloceanibacter sp.]|nr:MAG: hypothetical protein A49_19850 [Methyloceanibacter sp.]